ncbi:prolyl oligopeptidase family serine peptidase [uncultured Novosphingobium sp.]|uniref:S9 family peptidase n=1 Tax=uncultured Novosphingobium sp. TaxID=292277 RepID=UPI002591806C|nr:prolyl oligopeptidase family serine peptidase [uncultured Novosphingobium sp.]
MTRSSLAFGTALLVPFAALAAALPALAASSDPDTIAAPAAPDMLEANLSLPLASGLTGAAKAPVFAWVENRAGVRNVWLGGPGTAGRSRTAYREDDGIEISGLAFSPDGTRLAFVRGGDAEFPEDKLPNTGTLPQGPRQTLYVLGTEGSAAPVAIGEGYGAVFSPDGQQLVYTREGEITLWAQGASPRRLAKVSGTVGDLGWSPDGRLLVFREWRSGHSLVGLLDVAAGSLRYLGMTLGHSADPVFAPDGRSVAFIQLRDPPAELPDSRASFWSLRVADVATGAVRTVWSAPEGEGGQFYGTRGRNLFWTPTGHLLFPSERSGWLHVWSVAADGSGAARDLTPDANEVENFRPSPDGRSLVYSANPGDLDARQIWRVAIAGGKPQRLTPPDRFAFFPVYGGNTLAATVTDATHPAYPVAVEGMKPLGPVASARGFQRPEVVVFTAADGVKVHGQLFRAKGAGKHPALVFVHGGPRRQMLPGFSTMYYYNNAYVQNQAFAAAGYTVLSVNYRSGTNYGRAFREAPETARGGASEYRDVLAGGQWLAAQADVDPERVGIWGGSWGGYLTALALARDSALFKAGADFHGLHQMVRPTERTFAPDAVLAQQRLQWQSSPMGAIERWRSPVLIVHGDDDGNVDFGQSLLLARELTARGVPFEELAIPNERHDFFRYANWLTSYRTMAGFFDRNLKERR